MFIADDSHFSLFPRWRPAGKHHAVGARRVEPPDFLARACARPFRAGLRQKPLLFHRPRADPVVVGDVEPAFSVYLFFYEMATSGDLTKAEQKRFGDFVLKLMRRVREEAKLGMDRKNRELYSFETMLSSAPGEKYQIERRHEKLRDYYDHFKKTNKIKGD
jgi:hypothetical protein